MRFVLAAQAVAQMRSSSGEVTNAGPVRLDISYPTDYSWVGLGRLKVGDQVSMVRPAARWQPAQMLSRRASHLPLGVQLGLSGMPVHLRERRQAGILPQHVRATAVWGQLVHSAAPATQSIAVDGREQRLRQHLENGGFLHADDNYGMDKSFRREMSKVFPSKDSVELPPTKASFATISIFRLVCLKFTSTADNARKP